MEDYEVKDIILKYLKENNGKMTIDISKEIKLDQDQIVSCCLEMENRNHVKLGDVSTKGARNVFIVDITPSGSNFLNTVNGYKGERSKELWKNWGKEYKAPIIVGSIIALLTAVLALWQNQSSTQKYEQIKNQYEYQTRQIDTIKMLISSDTANGILPKSDTTIGK